MSRSTVFPQIVGGGFRATRNNVNQLGLVTGVETAIQLNVTNFDTYGAFDVTTNFRYNFPFDGIWLVQSQLRWLQAMGAAEFRVLRMRINGGANQVSNWSNFAQVATADGGVLTQSTQYIGKFVVGDNIYITGQQNSGANKDIDGSAVGTWLQGWYLGPG